MGSILIIGPGKLGSSLFRSFLELGYTSVFLSGRSAASFSPKRQYYPAQYCLDKFSGQDVKKASTIFITVPDRQIATVSKELLEYDLAGKTVIHTSGAFSSEILQALQVNKAALASFHPLQTFNQCFLPITIWRKIVCSYEGAEQGKALIEILCRRLKAKLIFVNKEQKLALHLAAVMTANFDVALLTWAERILQQEHLQQLPLKEIIYPIARQTLNNYQQKNIKDILSGPVLRGDLATIQKHLDYLEGKNLAEARLYAQLSRWLAEQKIFDIQRRQELLDMLSEK